MTILKVCYVLVVGAGLPSFHSSKRCAQACGAKLDVAGPSTWSRSGRGAGVQLQNGLVGNASLPSSTRHEGQA